MRSRSQASREAAYVEFVAARQAHLRRIAYVVCGDWRRADEILHGALVRLYVAWPRLERDGSEEAFVRRLILRAHVRSDTRQVPPRPADTADPSRDPVLDALLSLPPKQRRVVLLREWLGLSEEQTAEELGISVGTVRSLAARAAGWMPADLAQEAR